MVATTSIAPFGSGRMIAAAFEKSAPPVGRLILDAGVSIVGEFNVSRELHVVISGDRYTFCAPVT